MTMFARSTPFGPHAKVDVGDQEVRIESVELRERFDRRSGRMDHEPGVCERVTDEHTHQWLVFHHQHPSHPLAGLHDQRLTVGRVRIRPSRW